MGARNVRAALMAEKVSDRAVRVLVAMALISLDRQHGRHEPRVCWTAREEIAAMVGRIPDRSGVRYVDRAIFELVAAGYVERMRDHVGPGKPQTYRLHLPVENPAESVARPVDKPP